MKGNERPLIVFQTKKNYVESKKKNDMLSISNVDRNIECHKNECEGLDHKKNACQVLHSLFCIQVYIFNLEKRAIKINNKKNGGKSV